MRRTTALRRTFTTLGLLSLCLAFSGDTEAGPFRRRAARCAGPSCPAYAPTAYYRTPTASYYRTPAVGLPQDPPGFLAELNRWRASQGRPPAAWDANLAAQAASNRGTHDPASHPDSNQCWAPVRDAGQALALWLASPSHAVYLLNSTVVGFSPSATGSTCNAR